jgi:UDPglucose 6-dehydrogenase
MVRRGVGTDPRIGSSFLYAGPGYGGSCFPKDVRALDATARSLGVDFGILAEVDATNERQKRVPLRKARELLGRPEGSLDGVVVAVWGLAFKPNTDDIRDAPALGLIAEVLANGGEVRLYDPVAQLPGPLRAAVSVCVDPYEATEDADVLILMTEWTEFRAVDPDLLGLRAPNIVDARNVLDADALVEAGFAVASIGRPTRRPEAVA